MGAYRESDLIKIEDDLESAKASIDHTDMQKQCNEDLPRVPEDNKSKIEEPLIYKTMCNCIETSSHYYYNNVLS